MAVEKELDKTEANLGNIVFDESGYMIFYSTMLGIKLVNIYTNRCIRIIGKTENLRPMQLALFQVYEQNFCLIFLNHFSRLCRSLEECITVYDNGTLLYRPYQPMIQN